MNALASAAPAGFGTRVPLLTSADLASPLLTSAGLTSPGLTSAGLNSADLNSADLTIAGLPAHPLLVHGVVVLIPLAALAVVLHALWPAARRRLGVVTPILAVIPVVLVPITVTAGEQLADAVGRGSLINTHEALGRTLLPWVIALAVVALALYGWYRWGNRDDMSPGVRTTVRIVLAVTAIVVAAITVWVLVRVGDSGARAVWGSVTG